MNHDQGLTDSGPSAAGEAGDDWEDFSSGEALVEALNDVLEGEWPLEDYPDSDRFDARFLRGGAKRLDLLVQTVNKHRFGMDHLIYGMFITNEYLAPHLGPADHNSERVSNPARLIGKVMSGPVDEFVAYGMRGKEIAAAAAIHADYTGRAA